MKDRKRGDKKHANNKMMNGGREKKVLLDRK